MTALREEALQIVNETPEYLLQALVDNLQSFKKRQFNELDNEKIKKGEINPKKAAFAALEEWRVRNRKYSKLVVDWEKEFLEAIDEKFGKSH
ncbi:MAG: hypothetical protein IJQ16_10195 [Selenomonadaceae bacterium]|nr:hypothetical protein [Selenomonadaceae bacterium]